MEEDKEEEEKEPAKPWKPEEPPQNLLREKIMKLPPARVSKSLLDILQGEIA